MKADLTDITIVLDRSGSMSDVAGDTRGGFDSFVKDQQKGAGQAVLTLVQFDHEYEFVHRAKPIKDVPALDFRPRGQTALLDAIGKAITETGERLEKMAEAERPGKVVFVIITDGYENASKEFQKPKILEMITHQREKYGWQFSFLGANQDAIQVGGGMGIPIHSSLTYANSHIGTQSAFRAVSDSTKSFRAGASLNVSYDAAQRAEAMKKDEQENTANV